MNSEIIKKELVQYGLKDWKTQSLIKNIESVIDVCTGWQYSFYEIFPSLTVFGEFPQVRGVWAVVEGHDTDSEEQYFEAKILKSYTSPTEYETYQGFTAVGDTVEEALTEGLGHAVSFHVHLDERTEIVNEFEELDIYLRKQLQNIIVKIPKGFYLSNIKLTEPIQLELRCEQ